MNPNTAHRAYPNSAKLKTAGSIVRALDSIHPKLASAVVNRLFFMPFSKQPSAAERRKLDEAEHLSMPFREMNLAAYAWGSGPVVLVIHGWASNAGSLQHVVGPIVQAGFRVVAFDAPAHGGSPGRMTDAVEYGAAINVAIQSFAPIHAIFAHSFGATSALLLMAENPDLPVGAVAVNNPPAQLSTLIDVFADMLEPPERVISALHHKINERFGRPVEYFSLLNRARSLTIPGLVIADRGDTLATFEDTQQIASEWTGTRLLVTDGLGHQGALRDPKVIEEIVSFVTEQH